MKTAALSDGDKVPALGQGTSIMGERRDRRPTEIAALRAGVELGMTVIDTAEMYGDGAAATLIAQALGGLRNQLFLVSKAYPQNASRKRLVAHPALANVARSVGADRFGLDAVQRWGSGNSKAGTVAHVRENFAAAELVLSDEDVAALDAAFPRPRDRRPLEIL